MRNPAQDPDAPFRTIKGCGFRTSGSSRGRGRCKEGPRRLEGLKSRANSPLPLTSHRRMRRALRSDRSSAMRRSVAGSERRSRGAVARGSTARRFEPGLQFSPCPAAPRGAEAGWRCRSAGRIRHSNHFERARVYAARSLEPAAASPSLSQEVHLKVKVGAPVGESHGAVLADQDGDRQKGRSSETTKVRKGNGGDQTPAATSSPRWQQSRVRTTRRVPAQTQASPRMRRPYP